MKKFTISLLCIALLVTWAPISSLAQSLEKLPSTETSKQWEVLIGKGDHEDPKLNKSDKPGLYNIYSMDIKNIGDENVKLVRVEAYRDDPNSTKEYELFTAEYDQDKPLNSSFHHHNFPLYTKATKLKVILTWTAKSDESKYKRKFREQFVFER
ncbi:hypothetical protein ACQCWA_22975 [Rossellomorea aquimaris]|uniref:hypothetical protein n=1 Tax=Rossellomorea aquimaris TaxID=189382 RepID=UPI003CECADD8